MTFCMPAFHLALGLPLGLFLNNLAWYAFLVWELYIKTVNILDCLVSRDIVVKQTTGTYLICKIVFHICGNMEF